MGKRLSRYIYEERKALVLAAAASTPNCSITDLARMCSVSRTSVHYWLKYRQAPTTHTIPSASASASTHHRNALFASSAPDFVELAITDSDCNSNISSSSSDSVLRKISLTFSDFSLVIEGRVDSSKLTAILEILEERC